MNAAVASIVALIVVVWVLRPILVGAAAAAGPPACPKCGVRPESDARYCSNCGARTLR
jgi:hypothetical protein